MATFSVLSVCCQAFVLCPYKDSRFSELQKTRARSRAEKKYAASEKFALSVSQNR